MLASTVGNVPKESPLERDLILPWTMNFAAACNERDPVFYDNTKEAGDRLLVHPVFLSGCVEIIGFWASLYASGISKEEVIKHSPAHYGFDAIFHRPMYAGEIVTTNLCLAGMGQRKSGTHFVTRQETLSKSSGEVLCTSYWEGIVMKFTDQVGPDSYPAELNPVTPPPRPSPGTAVSREIPLPISPLAAHIWDGCIRDPRNPKAKSSDINPHTNLNFALKGGFPGRNLHGSGTVGLALTELLKHCAPGRIADVRRLGCIFGSPVTLWYEDMTLTIQVKTEPSLPDVLFFEVITPEGKTAVRNGYCVLGPAASAAAKL